MSGNSYVQPKAAWRVMLDGQDLTDRFAPRLVSLRLSEKRGEAADQLEIVLSDDDGALAIPPEGARLSVSLGWERGTGVTAGLVAKGSFKVDEVSWGGPPDQVTITARSADLKDSFRTRKSKVWKETTLGAIIGAIAGANGLKARCHPDLSGKQVTAAEQHNKSDMQFLRDRVIETGICGGLDLGWNLKRGGPTISTDALVWRHGFDDIIDIGLAYDDTSQPLRLQWISVNAPFYKAYSPRPSCQ